MQIVSIKTFTFRLCKPYSVWEDAVCVLWQVVHYRYYTCDDSINRVSSSCHVSVNFVWLYACLLNYVVAVVLVNWAQDKNWKQIV